MTADPLQPDPCACGHARADHWIAWAIKHPGEGCQVRCDKCECYSERKLTPEERREATPTRLPAWPISPEASRYFDPAIERIALLAMARIGLDDRIRALDRCAQVLDALRAELRAQREPRELRPEALRALGRGK